MGGRTTAQAHPYGLTSSGRAGLQRIADETLRDPQAVRELTEERVARSKRDRVDL